MPPSPFRDKTPVFADSLFSGLDAIAKATSLIERASRHLSAKRFMFALIKATLSGKASFNDLA